MRKVEDVITSPEFRRDAGKVFRITEMPALQAERWAWKVMIALKGTSIQIPEQFENMGMLAVTRRILNGFFAADINYTTFMPVLDELLECVQIVRDRAHPEAAAKLEHSLDLEEVMTVAWLRSEVLRVHTGFSIAESVLSLVFQATQELENSSPST